MNQGVRKYKKYRFKLLFGIVAIVIAIILNFIILSAYFTSHVSSDVATGKIATKIPIRVSDVSLDTHIGKLESPLTADLPDETQDINFSRFVLSDITTLSFTMNYAGESTDSAASIRDSTIKLAWGGENDNLPVAGYVYVYPSSYTASQIRNDVRNGGNSALNKVFSDQDNVKMNDGITYDKAQVFNYQLTDDYLVHPNNVDILDGDTKNDQSSKTFTFKLAFVRDDTTGGDGDTQLQKDFLQFNGKDLHVDISANTKSTVANHKTTLNLKAKIMPTMIAGTDEYQTSKFWNTTETQNFINKNEVETITFVDSADAAYTTAGGTIDTTTEALTAPSNWNSQSVVNSWDVSLAKDKTVLAFYTAASSGSSDKYDLYVAGRGGVLASNASYLFQEFRQAKLLTLDYLDICESESTVGMFTMGNDNGSLSRVVQGLSNLRTRNTTTFQFMFVRSRITGDIDLSYGGFADQTQANVGAWDTSNVTNMAGTFGIDGDLDLNNRQGIDASTLDLTGWDTSKVTTMLKMFATTRYLKEIKGIETFKTGQVTDFRQMFSGLGRALSVSDFTDNTPTLDLKANSTLGYWDMSNVQLAQEMFRDVYYMKNIDVTGWAFTKLDGSGAGYSYLDYLFWNTSNLKTITGINTWQTNGVRRMFGMFQSWATSVPDFDGVTANLDLSAQGGYWNVSNVINASSMFYGATTVKNLNLTGWTLTAASDDVNLQGMFQNTSQLKTITGINTWQTDGVINMSNMFYSWATGVTFASTDVLDLHADSTAGTWNVSKVTNFTSMFNTANKISTISVLDWDTSQATNMTNMFQKTGLLKTIIGISGFKTDNVTTMQGMFQEWATAVEDFDDSTTNLDLSAQAGYWNVSKLINASSMFYNANKVKNIKVTDWTLTASTNNVTLQSMFQSTSQLKMIAGINTWQTDGVKNMTSMFQSWATGVADFNEVTTNLDLSTKNNYWNVSNVTNANNMFYAANTVKNIKVTDWTLTATNVYLTNMFHSTALLKTITGINTWKTDGVVNMEGMFQSWATSVTFEPDYVLDLHTDTTNGYWNTSNVTSIGKHDWGVGQISNDFYHGMFQNANKIEKINLTGWDTSNIVTMSGTFMDTTNLKEIQGITGWATTSLTTAPCMFMSTGISTMDLQTSGSSWNVSKLTTPQYMFQNSKLTELNVTGWTLIATNVYLTNMFHSTALLKMITGINTWKTDGVVNMEGMFQNWATGVTFEPNYVLDLHTDTTNGYWNTSNVTSIGKHDWGVGQISNDFYHGMFQNANKIEKINLTGWDTSNIVTMSGTFRDTTNLNEIQGIANWTTTSLTTAPLMFYQSGLKTLDLTNWDTTTLSVMTYMFRSANRLSEIKIGANFNISGSANINQMTTNLASAVPNYTGKWYRNTHPTDLDTPVNIFMQNTTVTAGTWYAETTVEVTLDENYSSSVNRSFRATYNNAALIGYSTPTRAGLTFMGYYAEPECVNQVITNTGSYVNFTGYVEGGVWKKYSATTLYAKWSLNITESGVSNNLTTNFANAMPQKLGDRGDTVQLGTTEYDWWRILYVDEVTGSALIIREYELPAVPYHYQDSDSLTGPDDVYFADSSDDGYSRSQLKTEIASFYNTQIGNNYLASYVLGVDVVNPSFTAIVGNSPPKPTDVTTPNLSDFATSWDTYTSSKESRWPSKVDGSKAKQAFPLSVSDILHYELTVGGDDANPAPVLSNFNDYNALNPPNWWLRSVNTYERAQTFANNATWELTGYKVSDSAGIRPALWVKIN